MDILEERNGGEKEPCRLSFQLVSSRQSVRRADNQMSFDQFERVWPLVSCLLARRAYDAPLRLKFFTRARPTPLWKGKAE